MGGAADRTFRSTRRSVLVGFVITFVAFVLRAGHADAQQRNESSQPPPSASASYAQAQFHFTQGVAFAEQSRWQDAIRELETARRLRATAAVHFNLALAYRAVGRPSAAILAFREYFRSAGNDITPDRAATVNEYVRELTASLARLRVIIEPAGASLTVDGNSMSTSEPWHDIDPGQHLVLVQAEGFRPETRTVDVQPSSHVTLTLRLIPIAASVFTVTNGGRADSESRGLTRNPWFWTGAGLGVAAIAAIVITLVVVHPVAPIENVGVDAPVCVGPGC